MNDQTQAVAIRQAGALEALSVGDLVQQVNLIQQVMKTVMKEKEHYGTIPGCGDKPTLLKPGAEKLSFVFRLAPEYTIDERNLEKGHKEYRVICSLKHVNSGAFFGQGVGSCSTMESKWRYRAENTGKSVPAAYWDSRDSNLLGGSQFSARKVKNQWLIYHKVEHDNPADYFNTCLKMAKKRAHVDAVLTATAASDIFAQDIEDMAENGVIDTTAEVTKEEPKVTTEKLSEAGDWRQVVIHFGKNKGKKLGELPPDTISWYQDKWEPKEYPEGSGKFSAPDLALRKALNASIDEAEVRATELEEDNVPM